MDGSLIGTLALGFGLGLKHALDPDHLVAMSTIVGRQQSIWRASWIGAVWGMGHTASLFVAAVAVILLRVTISPTVALSMEFCVGLMLMVLGADLVRRVASGDIAIHSHTHTHTHGDGEIEHAHAHVHVPVPVGDPTSHHGIGKRPFIIGLVHGLAGSAALMLFVLSTIDSPSLGIAYVLVFGAGTIGGMLVMSALMSLPLTVASQRLSGMTRRLQLAVGVGSFLFGAVYTWQIAADDRLFGAFVR